jgi:hypothetical protein
MHDSCLMCLLACDFLSSSSWPPLVYTLLSEKSRLAPYLPMWMEGYGNIEINCKQIRCGNMDWILPAHDKF